MVKKSRIKGRSTMLPGQKLSTQIGEPTPEFKRQHKTRTETLDTGEKRTWVLDQRPIDWYASKDWITDDQWSAGDAYFKAFSIASQVNGFPSSGVNPDFIPGTGGGNDNPTDFQLDMYQKLLGMMRAVGRGSGAILWDICGQGYQVGEYEIKAGWRKGYGMVRLREALDDLGEYLRRKRRE